MKQYHLIYLRNGQVLLSNKSYTNWQQIQLDYEDYMTSTGFDSLDCVKEKLKAEYLLDDTDAMSLMNNINCTKLSVIELFN